MALILREVTIKRLIKKKLSDVGIINIGVKANMSVHIKLNFT